MSIVEETQSQAAAQEQQDERVLTISRIVGAALTAGIIVATTSEKNSTTRSRVLGQVVRFLPLVAEPGTGVANVIAAQMCPPLLRRALVGRSRAERAGIAFAVTLASQTAVELSKAQLRKLPAICELDKRGLNAKSVALVTAKLKDRRDNREFEELLGQDLSGKPADGDKTDDTPEKSDEA